MPREPVLRRERAELVAQLLADASAGTTRLLVIRGASGTGKTTHLRAVLAGAQSFAVRRADGVESVFRPAYGILQQLGVERLADDDGRPLHPAIAAQALRRLVDAAAGQPLVLAVDDAQWADEESLDAIRLVLQRMSGDRLLVVLAHRPFRPGDQLRWQRFCADPDAAVTLELDGVDLDEAALIVQRGAPGDPLAGRPGEPANPLVERLWRHTEGNPMHLGSLLRGYRLASLAGLRELPAPVEVSLEMQSRLAAMDPDAARLLLTVAVLSDAWVDRVEVAEVAGVVEAGRGLDQLLDVGLLVEHSDGRREEVRIVHALTRAALSQSMSTDERRELHRRAAEVLRSPMARLEHAVAAVEHHDDDLALRLEEAAAAARTARDHRREAQLLQWAARVARAPQRRERDWLESQLATLLTLDTGAVRARLSEIAWSHDVARRTVVVAWLLVAENRVADARRTLLALAPDVVHETEPLVRTRLAVLTAWSLLVSGYPSDEVLEALGGVTDADVTDPALRGYYVRTVGQIAARRFDFEHIRRDFDAAPIEARRTPLGRTDELAWRGAVYSLCGFAGPARRDLGEVVARIRGGRVEAGSGNSHALHAFALWQDGELDRASAELRAATDLSPTRLTPMAQAMLPFVPAVRGEQERAAALLAESELVLRDLPWREAVALFAQACVVTADASSDPRAWSACLARLRGAFGADVLAAESAQGAIWHLHVALAKVSAGELDDVEAHLVAIETDMIVPDWIGWVRPWLTALRRERQGDLDDALAQLHDAVAALDDELPLYRAHVHAMRSRLALRARETGVATLSAAAAHEGYTRLGALPHLTRLEKAAVTPEHPQQDVLGALSEREREVASLVLAGCSYAQIADELYVTRSTVAFHLGNVYAKTGVASRHQLIQLVRGR